MLRTAADQMPIPPRSSFRRRCGWTWWPTATCRRWRWPAMAGRERRRAGRARRPALVARPEILPPAGPAADREALAGARLFLEIDAHGLVECHEQIATLARVVSEFGAHIGVRRLAQQFGAVAQLHTLPLSYVKLGGGFVGGMSQSPGSQQLTASYCRRRAPEHRGVCGRRARRGNPAHPGRPGHQRDARSRRQAAGPAGLRSWPPDGGPRRAGPRSALVDAHGHARARTRLAQGHAQPGDEIARGRRHQVLVRVSHAHRALRHAAGHVQPAQRPLRRRSANTFAPASLQIDTTSIRVTRLA